MKYEVEEEMSRYFATQRCGAKSSVIMMSQGNFEREKHVEWKSVRVEVSVMPCPDSLRVHADECEFH